MFALRYGMLMSNSSISIKLSVSPLLVLNYDIPKKFAVRLTENTRSFEYSNPNAFPQNFEWSILNFEIIIVLSNPVHLFFNRTDLISVSDIRRKPVGKYNR